MRHLFALLLAAALGVAVVAQTPKEKDDKPAAPTARQLLQSQNNLKQIALAMHNYHDTYGQFPNNGPMPGQKGTKPVSWRVHILPFVEEDKLYKEMLSDYKWDEAWDSEANKKFVEKMPKLYAPIRVTTKEKGHTFYRGFTGTGTVFEDGAKVKMIGITDGTSNTVAVVEAGESVPWTKPEDLPFDAKKELPKLGGLFDGDFHMALCDGSVRRVKAKFDADTLKAMITRNGGEVVDPNKLDK